LFSLFRKLFNFIFWLIIILLIVALVAAIYLRTGLPKYNGEVQLEGITAKVDIIRDEYGIPHIYAENGTLSVYDYAGRSFVNLDQPSQDALTTYTAGVNSYLEQRSGPLPPEFLTFQHKPEAWQVADTLVWLKMMSWDLGGNWHNELLRTKLLKVLSPEQVQELFPPYPSDAPITLPDFRGLYDNLPIDELLAATENTILPNGLAGNPTNDLGSNNWVVSGEKTITGMPLLANDPHLAMQAPSIWYFAHINTPNMNVIAWCAFYSAWA